jgi:hypothetical protein
MPCQSYADLRHACQGTAREIRDFTGTDDPYEPPLHTEITMSTITHTAEANARLLLNHLIHQGSSEIRFARTDRTELTRIYTTRLIGATA